MELAIVETKTMKAYSGRVVQIVRGKRQKVMGDIRGTNGAHQYRTLGPDDIDANGICMRGGIGQKRDVGSSMPHAS